MQTDLVERFTNLFVEDDPTGPPVGTGVAPAWVPKTPIFEAFMHVVKQSYDQGALRFLPVSGSPNLADANGPNGWLSSWPQTTLGLWVFAYDWLGRPYGFNRGRTLGGEPTISRLDVGSGKVLDADVGFSTFVSDLLVEQREEVLALDFFREWLDVAGRPLRPTECVGLRVPRFLGGRDEVANLEITSVRVYLDLTGQLASQTATFKSGQSVTGVDIQR